MPIYGPEPIVFEGVSGDRYWFHESFPFTGIADIDEQLSGFPVSIFIPPNRPTHQMPLLIGIQGMCAPYGMNAFIVPTLIQMGIATVLFDTPLGGERSLVRTFTALVEQEIMPLLDRDISFDTKMLAQIFSSVARDINWVRDFCAERYGITDSRLALFGVSMGVVQSAFAFTAHGVGERLLGVIGHADLQAFAQSWSPLILPDLAVSPLGQLTETLLQRFRPDLKPMVSVLRMVKNLKNSDQYGYICNPMNYVKQVKPSRRVRFLVGNADPLVGVADACACAAKFPDGDCYVVPGLRHGQSNYGPTFIDHVRYFLVTQLGDWQD